MRLRDILNWKIIIGIIVLLIIIFFASIIGFFVDFQWYKEVGYLNSYLTRLFTKFGLGVPIFTGVFIIFYPYLLYLRKEYIRQSSIIFVKDQLKVINGALVLVSAIFSLVISFIISSAYWYDILKFVNAVSFNLKDPIFNKDVSFYMFKLPIYRALYSVTLGLIVILTIITVFFYLFMLAKNSVSDFQSMGNVLTMGKRARAVFARQIIEAAGRQLAFMVSAIFIVIGTGFILKSYSLVYSPRGVAFGASYTDVHVTLLFNRIQMVLSLLAAVSVFYSLYTRKVKMSLWVIGLMIGASIFQGVFEAGVERFIVMPNQVEKERQYIDFNIKYTKIAYGLDNVEEKDFPAEQNLTPEDIENNKNTISNIRINDFGPSLDVYNQLQGIRYYYRFNDVDIDRYNINGKYTQVFIAPRELDQSKLSGQTWQNKHLFYTHGYGIAMSPVNTVTEQGLPNLIIKDIPPVSSVDIKVDRPQIYFGEVSDDYIITNGKSQELDYPSGNENKQTTYGGSAGIRLNFLNRMLFMLNKGSLNFLLSEDITSNSRIIINRDILSRVQKIAPFLEYDKDPYIVINGGKLYWIIDAYTVSSEFPFSEPLKDINYIRNSVKVIIDAYNGTTDFYIVDDKDPVVMTYNKIFPGLFKSKKDVPQGFVEHFRYPQDIFKVQSEVYKKYHMTNYKVFYNKEDLWTIPTENNSSNQKAQNAMEPTYIVMKLPDGSKEEFMLIIPYTPSGKDNMVAWLGARMDGENYGKLILYKFPKQKVTYGPSQFKARVNQDSVISKELSLWNQQGSKVIDGSVITIPIEKSLIYVMPIYIRSTSVNSIPEMKRVILGYGDEIVMEETLDKALIKMFDIKNTVPVPTPSADVPSPNLQGNTGDLVRMANEAFNKAKEEQQKGNWAEYGKYLKELENILKQLETSVK